MATHSSILAGTEPGRLQSTGSQSWTWLKQLSTHAHVAPWGMWTIATRRDVCSESRGISKNNPVCLEKYSAPSKGIRTWGRKEPDVFRESRGLGMAEPQRPEGNSQRCSQGGGQRPVAHKEAVMSLSKRWWESQSHMGNRIDRAWWWITCASKWQQTLGFLVNCCACRSETENMIRGRDNLADHSLSFFKELAGTALVVQWLRLCAPSPGCQVQPLVRELDPACHH